MYGQEWRNMTNYGSTLANYVHPYYVYPRMSSITNMTEYYQLWPNMASVDKHDLIWSDMVQYCQL